MNLLLILLLGVVYGNPHDPEVTISSGRIKGIRGVSYDGNEYMKFIGIPYAAPPTGNRRFKDPVPVAHWKGTKIVNETKKCLQVEHSVKQNDGLSMGDEDCLYLNVYVPGFRINYEANLDVIVFIHGGAFTFGGAGFAQPGFLMDRNIILVSINYRVGILGFLSTGDKNLPGNLGMKDQVLALKWVRENIKYFGGNKHSVTLNGLSAGGASVHYHYLSPLSRGLFKNGISTSGCALNPWTIMEFPLEKAKVIGEFFNCPMENTEELVGCLMVQPATELSNSIRLLRPWLFNPFSAVALVVDASSPNPFLPKHPYEILVNKEVYDVPWMATFTTSEGLYPAAEFWASKQKLVDLNNYWNAYAPEVMHYGDVVHPSELDRVSSEIKDFYIPSEQVDEESFQDLVRMISDRLYISDIGLCQLLHSHAVKSPVHGYIYDYLPEKRFQLYNAFTNITNEKIGVGHGDDSLFVYSINAEKMTKNDEKMKNFLVNLFTDYAKYGNPNIKHWKPICKNGCKYNNYLYIGRNQELESKRSADLGEKYFWQSLGFNENANLFQDNVKSKIRRLLRKCVDLLKLY